MKGWEIITLLPTLDDTTLARIWTDFNVWEWPGDLPGEVKPDWWDGNRLCSRKEIMERKYGYVSTFMAYIHARVPDGLIQAAWDESAP